MKQITKFDDRWNKILAIVIIIIAIVYDISPVDLIPDVLIGVGQADDIIGTLYAICNVWIQFRRRNFQ